MLVYKSCHFENYLDRHNDTDLQINLHKHTLLIGQFNTVSGHYSPLASFFITCIILIVLLYTRSFLLPPLTLHRNRHTLSASSPQPESDWECDTDAMEVLIDSSTKAILITNPSNPCGSNYSPEHLLRYLLFLFLFYFCSIFFFFIYYEALLYFRKLFI